MLTRIVSSILFCGDEHTLIPRNQGRLNYIPDPLGMSTSLPLLHRLLTGSSGRLGLRLRRAACEETQGAASQDRQRATGRRSGQV